MMRRSTCVLLGVLSFVLVGFASPARAQTTALFVDSQPGDLVGGGVERTWTDADLQFSAHWWSGRVTIWASDNSTATWWSLTFGPPAGRLLWPGVYENASGGGNVLSTPILSIYGPGGCGRPLGRFHVYELEFDLVGELTRFAADFEQHCYDATPALVGAVRFNSTRSSLVPFDGAPPVYSLTITRPENGTVAGAGIDCGPLGADCDESYAPDSLVVLTATPAAGYVFLGWAGLDCVGTSSVVVRISRRKRCTPVFTVEPGGTGLESPEYSAGALYLNGPVNIIGYTPPPGQPQVQQVYLAPPAAFHVAAVSERAVSFRIGERDSSWQLEFGAPPGEVLAPGSYRYAVTTSSGRPASPLLTLSGDSTWCSSGGRFDVHEMVYDGYVLRAFAADFELPCGSSGELVTGSIRYYSSVPRLLPFDGEYPLYELEIVPTLGGHVASSGISCGDGGRTDCRETFVDPTAVMLEAVPSDGYEFIGWSGSCTGSVPLTAVTVQRAIRCFAIFTPSPGSASPVDPALAAASLYIYAPGSSSGPERALWFASDSRVTLSHSTYDNRLTLYFESSVGYGAFGFRPVSGPILPGYYEETYASANALFPAIEIWGCTNARGRVLIHQAEFTSGGKLLAFAADFEAYCSEVTRPYAVGAVRFNAARDTIEPFDGQYPLYRLTIAPAVNGTVTSAGIACGPADADCSETFGSPTTVTLTAIPATGYTFVGWGGACSGRAVTTVSVDRVRRCYAVFNSSLRGTGIEDPRVATASLLIDSQPGDTVGGGVLRVWTDAVVSSSSWSRSRIAFDVQQPDGATWRISFGARIDEELQPGTYEAATSEYVYPYVGPSLTVWGPPGSFCSDSARVTGRFVIHEMAFASPASPEVTAFSADFEYRCSPTAPALYGALRYNSTRAVLTPFTPDVPVTLSWPDFSGNGWPDLVWRHTATGHNAAWLMSGTSAVETRLLGPSWAAAVTDLDWEVRAASDMNGDARSDLVWQHRTTGVIAAWMLDGTTVLVTRLFSTLTGPAPEADLDWKIVGAADMNRDGHSDLVWRHRTSGALRVWHMNGLVQWDSVDLPHRVADPLWEVADAADMNRDGWPDIVWRHYGTGANAAWLMKDTRVVATSLLAPAVPDVQWRLAGVADMDRDGHADLVWQHGASGRLAVWYMNGLTLMRSALLNPSTVADTDWRIVAVK